MARAFVFPGRAARSSAWAATGAGLSGGRAGGVRRGGRGAGQKLSALIWEGTPEELTLTRNAQPALMATSIAAMRALEAEGVGVDARGASSPGIRSGNIRRSARRGAMGLADTARMLRLRGEAMQEAVPVGHGGDGGAARARPRGGRGVCGRRKPAGKARSARRPTTMTAARWWSRGTRRRSSGRSRSRRRGGAKRALLLPVSAPFHCALMAAGGGGDGRGAGRGARSRPRWPLVANVKAAGRATPRRSGGSWSRR